MSDFLNIWKGSRNNELDLGAPGLKIDTSSLPDEHIFQFILKSSRVCMIHCADTNEGES